MECKATVYGSEKTFRNYVTTNSKKISHLYLFKDHVADVIYFYCFFDDYLYIASSVTIHTDFSFYAKIYSKLATKLCLNFTANYHQEDSIIITK